MRVSVIATVYNEGDSIRTLMDSLVNQSRRPDEVIICDGGSRDGTVAILREYRNSLPGLRVIEAAGANISQGRNKAIAAAAGPIVATTDAGVRLDPRWLERLVAPLEAGGHAGPAGVKAVAGFFAPDVTGPFQMAMGATVLPLAEEVVPSEFLPSSRSMAFLSSCGIGWAAIPNGSTIVKIWYLISGSRLWLRKGKTPSPGRRTRLSIFVPAAH